MHICIPKTLGSHTSWDNDWVSKCRNLEVIGGIKKGRGKKTCSECVAADMKKLGLKKEDEQNRQKWSSSIVGNV